MPKRNKRLVIFGAVFLLSAVMLAVGLKYFPFTKVMKMPAGSEKEFVNPEKIQTVAPHTLYYDFEVAPGKEVPGGFYKGLAHSGQYSVKAFGQNSFSIAVERTAGEIGVENLKAVALSAWIYVFPTKKEVKGSLVFTASNEVGVNVCWQGVGIVEPEVPKGKWFKISKYFDLTTVAFKPGYKLQVYFWNNSSTDILVDDYFISFGGPVDRRGDSARVDMTKPAGYVPEFNYPPFPVSFMEREVPVKGLNPADFSPEDFMIAGNFMNTGNDGLLVIRKDGTLASYACCPDQMIVKKIPLGNPNACSSIAPVTGIMKGRFLPSQDDQFIVTGAKGWMLCALTPPDKVCNSTGSLQTSMKVLGRPEGAQNSVVTGDFTGDRRSEILVTDNNGSWKVMAFVPDERTGGSLKIIANDDGNPVAAWNRGNQEIGMSAGRFIPANAHDILLTVTRSKTDGTYAFSLWSLHPSATKWVSLFSEKQQHQGKTIGLDTLKPTDLFFAVPAPGNKTAIFRYNRDWRYDLKEIRFNDSTFIIGSNVDFLGYDRDQNPKYYESLKLVPGHFLNTASVSFLAIGSVSRKRHYQSILPDFAHFYSLPVNK